MGKIFACLLFCISAFGQHSKPVATTVLKLQTENARFTKTTLFEINPNIDNSRYSKNVTNATAMTLDVSKVNTLFLDKPDQVEIEIPYLFENITVLLYKVEIQSENFHIDTDKATNVTVEKGVFYRGIIKDDMHSLVSFNIFKNQVNGIISSNKYGNLVIGKLNTASNQTDYIIYADKDLTQDTEIKCSPARQMLDLLPEVHQARETSLTNNCVTVYFEIDYALFQANGSDIGQTTIWINSVFNNVQTLFNNDNIKIAIKSVFIWTTEDPYNGSNIFLFLDSFHQNRPFFDGDVGQLLTLGTGLGGVAAANGGLCSPYNYLYSDVFFSFSEVPAYSWTVQTIAHELGHIMGSYHTHDCVWNGNNTPIDGCGPSIGYPGIYTNNSICNLSAPDPENGGTIMSYCYATGVGNNFANGFGPQPAARIAQYVDASSCLGNDCINTCIATVHSLTVSSISTTSASISWSDNNASNNSWQVAAVPYPSTPTSWITVNNVSNFTFPELLPNTYYRFFVRNNCGALDGVPVISAITATADNYCSGTTFTDTGGISSNYSDYENWIRVLLPSEPNSAIKVTFSSIDIETDYDFLHVHDGPNTSAPELVAGGITGTALVGPFTSTDPSGALTFQFISDTNTNGAGWNATVSCVNLGVGGKEYLDYSYYPNPVTNELHISSANEISKITIFSIDGKLLFENNATQYKATVNTSAYASGTYIVKLEFNNKSVSFKVMK